jgi:hypothetical protein
MSTTRLGRIAREALLLLRQFLGQGDFHHAADASLKAAEIFKELAKHSNGSAHRIAFQRAKIMIEITKVLKRGDPLPSHLVGALDSFYPAASSHPKEPTTDLGIEPTSQVRSDIEDDESSGDLIESSTEESHETHHELLNGIAIACKISDMIDRASKSIRIMVQNFTDVKTITVGTETCYVNLIDRLVTKAEEGVKIRLIIRDPEAFGGLSDHFRKAVEQLLQRSSTIEILVCTQIHIKAIVVDEREVLEGSANFTGKGLSGIGEQATWTSNSDFVSNFVERFDRYWVHQSTECTGCKNRTCEVHPLTRRV